MSHYYSRCYATNSSRGEATRCGHKTTGITARADSYSVGAKVQIEWSNHLNTDVVHIYATNGSSSHGSRIFSYYMRDGERVILDTSHPELLI